MDLSGVPTSAQVQPSAPEQAPRIIPAAAQIGSPLRKRRKSTGAADEPSLNVASQNNPTATAGQTTGSKPKDKVSANREREAWSTLTITWFFDALKLYGKQFDSISKFISTKMRRFTTPPTSANIAAIKTPATAKGPTAAMQVGKSYEQVRNFYFNTFGKLAHKLGLSNVTNADDNSPVAQAILKINKRPREERELFILINYGEWRRRTGMLNVAAFREKFLELVVEAMTTLKANSVISKHSKHVRVIKIKTPKCPALMKFVRLNNNNNATDSTSTTVTEELAVLPAEIAVKLVPLQRKEYVFVCSRHQNPLMKAFFSPNLSMLQIFQYLERKWCKSPSYYCTEESQDSDISGLKIRLVPSSEHRICSLHITPNLQAVTSTKQQMNAVSLKLAAESDMNTGPGQQGQNREAAITSSNSEIVPQSSSSDSETREDIASGTSSTSNNGCIQTQQAGFDRPKTYVISSKLLESGLCYQGCMSDTLLPTLTIGHVYLMCGKPEVVSLEYEVIHDLVAAQIASSAWTRLLTLMRSDFFALAQRTVGSFTASQDPLSCALSAPSEVPKIPAETGSNQFCNSNNNNICGTFSEAAAAAAEPLVSATSNTNSYSPAPSVAPALLAAKTTPRSSGSNSDVFAAETNNSPSFSMAKQSQAFMAQLGQLQAQASKKTAQKSKRKVVVRSFTNEAAFQPDKATD